jgi:SWI/SNF-related matrix-associated actin-dependent regulator of chromatin subfamily B protein 1
MNPEELQQMTQGAPEMTPEQMQLQEQQDQQLAQAGVDPEQNPEAANQAMQGQQGQPTVMSPDQFAGQGFEMGGEPQEPQEPDAQSMLNEVILQYMDFAIGIKNDKELDQQVKSKIMAEQAGAISSLVQLLNNSGEMEMAKMRHEMDLKYQEHEMDMQIKQQELEMKKQEAELKLHLQAQQGQQKIQQQEQQHQTKLVQGQESHETKLQQQKQAAQSKQSSNPSSN